MSGGLIQLVALGIEDMYLTSKPEVTFFKIVYKRHTNFSLELIPQLFNTTPDFGKRVTCNISNNGDLMSNIYIVIDLPNIPLIYENGQVNEINKFAWCHKIGFALINHVELEIGGNVIDKHYSDWLNIWSELNETTHQKGLNKMIGNIDKLNQFTTSKDSYRLHIPLNFWFCRHKGLALPLIALHFSDVKINVEFNELDTILRKSPTHYIEIDEDVTHFKSGELLHQIDMDTHVLFDTYDYKTKRLYYIKFNHALKSYTSSSSSSKENYKIWSMNGYYVFPKDGSSEINYNINTPYLSFAKSHLLVNYIFLDNHEREQFSKSKHEYLIDFLQFSGDKSVYNTNLKFNLGFTHPSKEIIWIGTFKNKSSNFIKNKFDYGENHGDNLIKKTRLLLNGQERTSNFDNKYYNYIQPYKYHLNAPSNGINIYSFSLDPNDKQPHGSCNFSSIDDIVLEMSISREVNYKNPAIIKIYNLGYNIFRIINGISGLTFSN